MAAPKPCIARARVNACGKSTAVRRARRAPAAPNPITAVASALSNPLIVIGARVAQNRWLEGRSA
jgi:hypothetical protein